MKVQVGSLNPNPYRRMDKYPIDREKVESLKLSILDTSFWDNILARKNGDAFQIAYGHHRLIALKELEIKIVDIPVKDLTDAQMLKIMANENMEDWRTSPRVMNETVLAAKDFLDAELAKWESWEEFCADKSISTNFPDIDNAKAFVKVKQQGVGRETIKKFLNGNWKDWHIQQALDTLKADIDEEIDREAVEEFPKLEQAAVFKRAVREHKIPLSEQLHLAKKIVKEDVGSRGIPASVRTHAVEKFLGPQKKKEPPWIGEFVMELSERIGSWRIELTKITAVLDEVKPSVLRPLASALERLCSEANKIITRSNQ